MTSNVHSELPIAVVLSCRGGSQGDLGVVRALGRMGVPVVVVSEYETSMVRHSRYVREFLVRPTLFSDPEGSARFLADYCRRQSKPPVVIPTADPDVLFLSRTRSILEPHCRLVVSQAELVEGFVDKEKFSGIAARNGFRVPRTLIPADIADLEAQLAGMTYPVIMKPINPQAWAQPAVARLVDGKKALRIDSRSELLASYTRVAGHDRGVVIQEYIPGRDDALYSLHTYMDRDSEPIAWFTGRKIRTYPAHAGIGCFVESCAIDEIARAGSAMLKSVQYTGLALLQFKRDPRDGSNWLIEINPRASSWNLLAYACGVNLPFVAYCDTAGLPVPEFRPQKQGVKYLFLDHDIRALREYRRAGEWGWWAWLNSLRGRKVFQYLAADDMRPFMVASAKQAVIVGRRITRVRS